jgi:hypothetical protein
LLATFLVGLCFFTPRKSTKSKTCCFCGIVSLTSPNVNQYATSRGAEACMALTKTTYSTLRSTGQCLAHGYDPGSASRARH